MFGRAALLLLAAAALPAQAPKITQQGDPTVKSDTIYKLAVKALAAWFREVGKDDAKLIVIAKK